MDEAALKSIGGHVRLITKLLVGLLLVGALWLGVDTVEANGSTRDSARTEQVVLLATAQDDGPTGIDDVDPGAGFGATLGIILGISAVVVYGYMRMRNQ